VDVGGGARGNHTRTRQRGVDLGTRTTTVDVEIDAIGLAVGHGYDLALQRALLTAWWGWRSRWSQDRAAIASL